MSAADFYSLTRRHPFVPFRIVTSDGTIYDVRHPDMVLVTLSSVVVAYPAEQDPQAYGRYDIVSLRHVVRLEPAPTAEAAGP